MTIGEIKDFMRRHKISQIELSKKSGVPIQTLNKIFAGITPNPRIDTMNAICSALGISSDSNIPQYSNIRPLTPYVRLPKLGTIRAGKPIYTEQGDYDTEYADAEYGDGEHFMLDVKGDSMSPTIPDGSIAIVHKQDTAERGQIVVFVIEDAATLKRYFPQSNGDILLRGDNPEAETYLVTPSQLESGEARILGLVKSYKVNL